MSNLVSNKFSVDLHQVHKELGLQRQFSKWFHAEAKRGYWVEGEDYINKGNGATFHIFVTEAIGVRLRGVYKPRSVISVVEAVDVKPQSVSALKPYEHNGQRVVTLAQIDAVHGRPEGTASRNFLANKDKLVEGEDYWSLTGNEIRGQSLAGAFPARSSGGTILTESGYLMLVKSFTDDLAWKVQKQLVNIYFRKDEVQATSFQLPQTYEDALEDLAKQSRLRKQAEAEKQLALEQKVVVEAFDQLLETASFVGNCREKSIFRPIYYTLQIFNVFNIL